MAKKDKAKLDKATKTNKASRAEQKSKSVSAKLNTGATKSNKRGIGGLGRGLGALIPMRSLDNENAEVHDLTPAIEKTTKSLTKTANKAKDNQAVSKTTKVASSIKNSTARGTKRNSLNSAASKVQTATDVSRETNSDSAKLDLKPTIKRQEAKTASKKNKLESDVTKQPVTNLTAQEEALTYQKEAVKQSKYLELPLSEIVPNKEQPRQHFDEEALNNLAMSLKSLGMLQPILVEPFSQHGEHTIYRIVAGERRWRAAHLAKLKTVPVIVCANDQAPGELLKEALVENVQREDLNPIEEAEAYQKLASSYGMSQQEIATLAGKSRPAVANLLRLLKLPLAIKTELINGTLSEGQARPLLQIEDEKKAIEFADKIKQANWTARKVEAEVQTYLETLADLENQAMAELNQDEEAQAQAALTQALYQEQVRRLQAQLLDHFGQAVKFVDKAGKGQIVLKFHDYAELQEILAKFGITSDF